MAYGPETKRLVERLKGQAAALRALLEDPDVIAAIEGAFKGKYAGGGLSPSQIQWQIEDTADALDRVVAYLEDNTSG